MRRWLILFTAVLLASALVANTVASSLALADFANRPILLLTRKGGADRVKVQAQGQPHLEGQARLVGGQGILFGYSFAFALPDGASVTCSIRLRTLTCNEGWTAERAS